MIKANELRIGDSVLFNDNTDRHGIIVELHEHYAKLKTNYIPDHWENVVSAVTVDYDTLWAIPLTEEWLLKFGFALFPWGWVKLSKNEFGVRLNIKTYSYEVSGNSPVNIKYVHQLQNLFFALTGEELLIKELEPA